MNKIKPLWVQVLWSEHNSFKNNQLLSFIDFERLAMKAAIDCGTDRGYCKTKVNVLFNNGDEYTCRLDLALEDTHGFEQHAKGVIKWYETRQDDSCEQDLYADCYAFLKTIDFNNKVRT